MANRPSDTTFSPLLRAWRVSFGGIWRPQVAQGRRNGTQRQPPKPLLNGQWPQELPTIRSNCCQSEENPNKQEKQSKTMRKNKPQIPKIGSWDRPLPNNPQARARSRRARWRFLRGKARQAFRENARDNYGENLCENYVKTPWKLCEKSVKTSWKKYRAFYLHFSSVFGRRIFHHPPAFAM